MGQDHVGLGGDHLLGERLILVRPAGREAYVDVDVAALRPSQLFHSLPESGEALLHVRLVRGRGHQHADPSQGLPC